MQHTFIAFVLNILQNKFKNSQATRITTTNSYRIQANDSDIWDTFVLNLFYVKMLKLGRLYQFLSPNKYEQ